MCSCTYLQCSIICSKGKYCTCSGYLESLNAPNSYLNSQLEWLNENSFKIGPCILLGIFWVSSYMENWDRYWQTILKWTLKEQITVIITWIKLSKERAQWLRTLLQKNYRYILKGHLFKLRLGGSPTCDSSMTEMEQPHVLCDWGSIWIKILLPGTPFHEPEQLSEGYIRRSRPSIFLHVPPGLRKMSNTLWLAKFLMS
jgi:hypothetical protein